MNVIEKYFPKEHRERVSQEESIEKTEQPLKNGITPLLLILLRTLLLSHPQFNHPSFRHPLSPPHFHNYITTFSSNHHHSPLLHLPTAPSPSPLSFFLSSLSFYFSLSLVLSFSRSPLPVLTRYAEPEENARPNSPSNWACILPSLRSTCTVLLSCGGF
jgi:hypothetical protein